MAVAETKLLSKVVQLFNLSVSQFACLLKMFKKSWENKHHTKFTIITILSVQFNNVECLHVGVQPISRTLFILPN